MKHDQTSKSAAAPRDGFSSRFGVFAATLGSAVGLGNLWKVPYMTGANGGAAFLLVYLLATLLIGLPVMMAEISMGRKSRADAITTLHKLSPTRAPWWLVGVLGMLAAFLILAFYSEVAAWIFAYIAKALSGNAISSDPEVTGAEFAALIADPMQSLLWQWLVLGLIGGILMLGVTKGIEAVAKRLMPLLFILLTLLCIASLTLDEAGAGLAFLFKPDLSQLTTSSILAAMGLAFFKLSVGMGTMITYGSYFKADLDIPVTAFRVMCADVTVSLLAGIAIFPAVFTFGFVPEAGPSLVFITLPAVFSQLPFGQALMVAFFVLAAVAATGALLSLLEVPIAILHERLRISRARAAVLTLGLLALPAAAAALSQNLLSDVSVAGMTLFELFDYMSSNVLLPLGGILIALFVGWRWGWPAFSSAISNEGELQNHRLARVVFTLLKYITPPLILIVMVSGLGMF